MAMNEEKLAAELKYYVDAYYGILHALRDNPEFPKPWILTRLSAAGKYPEDWKRGKILQRRYGLDVIPAKQECEQGAGFWDRLRTEGLNK